MFVRLLRAKADQLTPYASSTCHIADKKMLFYTLINKVNWVSIFVTRVNDSVETHLKFADRGER